MTEKESTMQENAMTEKKELIKLGDKVEDVYTGFKGIAVARTEWLYGCSRISIEPTELGKEGLPIESQAFDEQRIRIVERKERVDTTNGLVDAGGPYPDVSRGR